VAARNAALRVQGAEAPARRGHVPRLLPATDPRPSCKGEATVELMTARLVELVNARIERLITR
jgi:hypothetical protein